MDTVDPSDTSDFMGRDQLVRTAALPKGTSFSVSLLSRLLIRLHLHYMSHCKSVRRRNLHARLDPVYVQWIPKRSL